MLVVASGDIESTKRLDRPRFSGRPSPRALRVCVRLRQRFSGIGLTCSRKKDTGNKGYIDLGPCWTKMFDIYLTLNPSLNPNPHPDRLRKFRWASVMCRTGRHETLCRTCVGNVNLSRRPTPTRLHTNLSLTLTPALGGPRSAGAAARLRRVFWWCVSEKPPRERKASLDQ